MSSDRFDGAQARSYWRSLHESARGGDGLDIVCHPGMPRWFNAYFAWCQERAFGRAVVRCGSLSGARALDVGCGVGRWSSRLRALGAVVLGIDLSEDAVEEARSRVPGVEFRAADVLDPGLAPASFDLVLSVTVLAHLPPEEQALAATELGTLVRLGGHVVLLENTGEHDRHVFSRPAASWAGLFGDRFETVWSAGYGFDLPLRAGRRLARRRAAGVSGAAPGARRRAHPAYLPLVAASYVTERIATRVLPGSWATHHALVLRRTV